MKYWNIELDILHGQQAFISAKSAPRNEASIAPPAVPKDKRTEAWLQPGGLCLWPVGSESAGICGETVHRFSTSLSSSCWQFSFHSKSDDIFSPRFVERSRSSRNSSSFFLHLTFPFNAPPPQKKTIDSRRNALLCVFECAARHLSTLCSHLVPLGLNMIMVVVNLFAEEAFAAKGA